MQHLEFGQTPWDNFDSEALRREAQRMYTATSAAYIALAGLRNVDRESPYWTPGGSGAHSLELARQVVKGAEVGVSDDHLTLLRDVQRLYEAVLSAASCLSMLSSGDTHVLRWRVGLEARALRLTRQVVDGIEAEYEPEEVYRAFFRYAVDLLFTPQPIYGVGKYWLVCDSCGDTIGGDPSNMLRDGKPCAGIIRKTCPGTLHVLTWADLAPREMSASASALPRGESE